MAQEATPEPQASTPETPSKALPERSSVSEERKARVERLILKAANDEEADLLFRFFSSPRLNLILAEEYEELKEKRRQAQAEEEKKKKEKKPILAKGEIYYSPTEALGNKLLQLFYKEDPMRELVELAFAGEIDSAAFQQFGAILSRLEGVVDTNARFEELAKMRQEGLITNETAQAASSAFLRDNANTLKFLASFAGKKYGILRETHGRRVPPEAAEDVLRKLYAGFVGKAEGIRKSYVDKRTAELREQYGDNIPSAELEKVKRAEDIPEPLTRDSRDAADELPRQLRLSLENQIGTLALEEVEEARGRDFGYDEIEAIVRIIFGNDSAQLLRATRNVYQKIYEEYKKTREERSIITSRPTGRPLWTLTNRDAIAREARNWLARSPELPKEESEKFLEDLGAIEGFLSRRGDQEMKERIRSIRNRKFDFPLLEKATAGVFEVSRELAAERGGFEREVGLVNAHLKEINNRIRELLRELLEINPLFAKGVVERLLYLNMLKGFLLRERSELRPEEPLLEEQVAVERFSPASFTKKASEVLERAVAELRATEDRSRRSQLEEATRRIDALRDEDRNYFERLAGAAFLGIISSEEYRAYMAYVEASAQANEIEAKDKEAYLVVAEDVDASTLSPKQREKLGADKAKAKIDMRKLLRRAANLRKGDLKGKEEDKDDNQ